LRRALASKGSGPSPKMAQPRRLSPMASLWEDRTRLEGARKASNVDGGDAENL
jgi:hypothetical protein